LQLQVKGAADQERQLQGIKRTLEAVHAGARAQLEHVLAASVEHAALQELVYRDVENGERALAREMEREHERVLESERQRQQERERLLEREKEHALERERAREQEWERERARERLSADLQFELERERARASEALEQLRQQERDAAADTQELVSRVSTLEAGLERTCALEEALATAGLYVRVHVFSDNFAHVCVYLCAWARMCVSDACWYHVYAPSVEDMHTWKLTSLQTSQTCNSDSLRREVLAEAEHLRAELEERTASLHEAERTCREAEAAIDELQRGKDTLLRANAALTALQQEHVRGRDEVKALLVTTQVAAQEVSDVSAQVRRELLACLGAQHALGQTVVVLRAEEAQLLRVVEEQKVALRHVQDECESARSALQILLNEKQSAHAALGAVLGEVEARNAQHLVEDEREMERKREMLAQWQGVGEILSDPTNGLCTLNRRILHLVQEQCAEEAHDAADAHAVGFGVVMESNVNCTRIECDTSPVLMLQNLSQETVTNHSRALKLRLREETRWEAEGRGGAGGEGRLQAASNGDRSMLSLPHATACLRKPKACWCDCANVRA